MSRPASTRAWITNGACTTSRTRCERLPLLADAEIVAEWAGLYEVTPDDQPILGRIPQVSTVSSCARDSAATDSCTVRPRGC